MAAIILTADEALIALQNLTVDKGNGTRYYEGLHRTDQLNSPKNPFFATVIGYSFADGQNSRDRLNGLSKARDVKELVRSPVKCAK